MTNNSRFIYVNGFRLNRVLCERVQARVTSQLSTLDAGKSYTLREICGEDWWVKTLQTGEPSVAGTFIVHLAVRGKIPLKCIGRNSAKSYEYVLTS
jgi:hypothetical protein